MRGRAEWNGNAIAIFARALPSFDLVSLFFRSVQGDLVREVMRSSTLVRKVVQKQATLVTKECPAACGINLPRANSLGFKACHPHSRPYPRSCEAGWVGVCRPVMGCFLR